MCVMVVVSPSASTPTSEELAAMARANPHGIGAAWVSGAGRVQWRKGLRYSPRTVDLVSRLPRPLVLHFRLASAGGTDRRLTHPFPIRTSADLGLEGVAGRVLLHNGHWSPYDMVGDMLQDAGMRLPSGLMSDTRLLAHLLARMQPAKAIAWLKRLANAGQKFALVDSQGVSMFGKWEQDSAGWWASNNYWKFTPATVATAAVSVTVRDRRRFVTPITPELAAWAEDDETTLQPYRKALARLTDEEWRSYVDTM